MSAWRTDVHYVDELTGRGRYAFDENAPRPNVFLITVDMIPPEAHRRDGYRDVMHTPNLDRLQRESVTFTNAFCTSPLCTPSRAAYLTGRYPYLIANEERAHDGMAFELRRDDTIFPEYLRHSGYVTRHVGKCHVGTAKFGDAFGENDHPWNHWAPPLDDDDEYHQYLEDLGVKGWRFSKTIPALRGGGEAGEAHFGGWVEQEDGRPFPREAMYPWFLATRAARTLRALRRRTGRGRPIYLQLDFFGPHQPFIIPGGLEERERKLREAIKLPSSFYDARDANFGALPGEPMIYQVYRKRLSIYREEALRDYLLANLLQVEVIDAALGVFFQALREEALYDDAVIIFMGDHGEMNGERALVDKGVYGHPKVMRAPLLFRAAGGENGGRDISTPVSLLDVAPTVLGMCGITPAARLDGCDLMPMIRGESTGRPQDFIFEAFWHVAPNPAVAIQHRYEDGRHFTYTFNLCDRNDELYDLNDAEFHNLAGAPEFQEVRADMIRRLWAVLRRDRRWRCYWDPMRLAHGDCLTP